MNPPNASDHRSGLPKPVIWGGGILLLLVISFAMGTFVGSRPVGELTRRVDQADIAAREGQAREAALEARLHAHQALSLLHRTMLDVDARNFGTANQRLDDVVAALAQVDRDAFGPGAGSLDNLQGDLAELDLRVADDLAEQRSTLSGLVERLVELLEA
jgi:hypothetical protein